MNTELLIALGKNALTWAKTYVALKESLVRAGVHEAEAREEARNAANFAAIYDPVEDGETRCPLCGDE